MEVIANLLSDLDSRPGMAERWNYSLVFLQHVNDGTVPSNKPRSV